MDRTLPPKLPFRQFSTRALGLFLIGAFLGASLERFSNGMLKRGYQESTIVITQTALNICIIFTLTIYLYNLMEDVIVNFDGVFFSAGFFNTQANFYLRLTDFLHLQ